MAALKDIKRKITAVQKTRQITRAMNMVAASKFKAAQTRMENFRPYAAKFMEVLNSLALQVDSESHPLLAVREPKRIRVICMTSDRGLCGGFNNNLIKATERFIREKTREGREVELIPIGRKGRDFFRKKEKIINARPDVFGKFDMSLAVLISGDVLPPFVNEEYDELYILYNEFVDLPWPGFSPSPPSDVRSRANRTICLTPSTSPRRRPCWKNCSRCTFMS
jgi:F-type H+-transporting ATPase subunit gamma